MNLYRAYSKVRRQDRQNQIVLVAGGYDDALAVLSESGRDPEGWDVRPWCEAGPEKIRGVVEI